MDIASLAILIAAIEEKSLSRAAERENLVTSAASKRIAELERRAGTALLRRHGRGVEPTPAGAMLYQRAKAIVRSVQLAQDALASYSMDGIAKIRLASNRSTILQFLPTDISGFLKHDPDARIDLIEAFSFDIPRMVANGDADIGIYHARSPSPGVLPALPQGPCRTGRAARPPAGGERVAAARGSTGLRLPWLLSAPYVRRLPHAGVGHDLAPADREDTGLELRGPLPHGARRPGPPWCRRASPGTTCR
jgi:DNA-binding transcriptional LysR family regulator